MEICTGILGINRANLQECIQTASWSWPCRTENSHIPVKILTASDCILILAPSMELIWHVEGGLNVLPQQSPTRATMFGSHWGSFSNKSITADEIIYTVIKQRLVLVAAATSVFKTTTIVEPLFARPKTNIKHRPTKEWFTVVLLR